LPVSFVESCAKLSGREALIYLLLEHQSTSDPLMALRLLGYLNRIWQQVIKRDPSGRLIPAIIPLVVYHGAKCWQAPTRFAELVDLNDEDKQTMASLIPDFGYLIDDLSGQSDEQLSARAIGQVGLLTLLSLQRLPNAAEPEAVFERMTDLIAQVVSAPSGMEALTAVLCYLFKVSESEPLVIRKLLEEKVGQRAVEVYMTTADRLKEEGRAEGEAKGRAEGRAEILSKLLTLKFGALSAEIEEQLGKADIEDLDKWSERVLSAQRLEEVFA
jgi:predicted transposase YdaD